MSDNSKRRFKDGLQIHFFIEVLILAKIMYKFASVKYINGKMFRREFRMEQFYNIIRYKIVHVCNSNKNNKRAIKPTIKF